MFNQKSEEERILKSRDVGAKPMAWSASAAGKAAGRA
jgi:hypothetical protein